MMKRANIIILVVCLTLLTYFLAGRVYLMDDGFHYQGFAQALAGGDLDFKSYYGFQGLSIISAITYLITRSDVSIVITSAILVLLSVPFVYWSGKAMHGQDRDGAMALILFLLTPYPYVTMMRGFQEAALLFFIILTVWAALNHRKWTPLTWGLGGIVKPFSLVLFPLFIRDFIRGRKLIWLLTGILIGAVYLGLSYMQLGHLVNNAAINSYSGFFDTGNPPGLVESFTPELKGFLRVGANLLIHTRKIMVSPFVIMVGLFYLWRQRSLVMRKEIFISIVLNVLLVGLLTFSFPKYLLPMTFLLSLVASGFLARHAWAAVIMFVDSAFVFWPIWSYFGHVFWPNVWVFLIPFYLSILLYFFYLRALKISTQG